jgi:choline/ethanolamine kinase
MKYGNILIRQPGDEGGEPEVFFVDFEYSIFGPRALDVANHFCEWTANYHSTEPHRLNFSQYPTEADQKRFIAAYLGYTEVLSPEQSNEVHKLRVEATAYSMASHLLWGMWGIVQSTQSTIDFNFLDYGVQRLTKFYEWKDQRRGRGDSVPFEPI